MKYKQVIRLGQKWKKKKKKGVSTLVPLLVRQKNEPFLDRVITGDEKWIMYHNIKKQAGIMGIKSRIFGIS